MNSAVINVKVTPDLKSQAQSLVDELGLSLSGVITGFLKQLIRTRTVTFKATEEPSDYLIEVLKKSEEEIKAGKVISFSSGKKALEYFQKLADEPSRIES